jgi:hypothetical protein
VIYDGFKTAVAAGVPKEKAGILVDEQFGAAILRDAATRGYVTACPAEKSGQEEFDFHLKHSLLWPCPCAPAASVAIVYGTNLYPPASVTRMDGLAASFSTFWRSR